MSAPGIEFDRVSKRYGDRADAPLAVREISFAAPAGTLTTILGPSGCGKTTTLRMIAGLEHPTSGVIRIAGRDVTHLPPSARDVSLVFQSYALFPHMNVFDNVAYGLKVTGKRREEIATRVEQTLETVGLTGYGARWPGELSGGQQQRVAVARALVLQPAVLLFDEPLSNLDARLRRSMRDEIRTLQQRLRLTVAYVTHDQGEALAVSDRIIVMNEGRIAQAGTPRELYERPADAFVAAFIGEALLLPGTVAGSNQVALGPLRAGIRAGLDMPAGTPVRVAIRPETWRIGAAGSAPLAGSVRKATYLGAVCEYTIETELGEIFVISHDVAQPRQAGDAVALTLATSDVAVLPAS